MQGRVHPPVPVPEAGDRTRRTSLMTQALADAYASGIAEHPQDWHMLQRLWLADLPPRAAAEAVPEGAAAGEAVPAASAAERVPDGIEPVQGSTELAQDGAEPAQDGTRLAQDGNALAQDDTDLAQDSEGPPPDSSGTEKA
jgi:KDO2-lipid IV(A) lauroyltransferase